MKSRSLFLAVMAALLSACMPMNQGQQAAQPAPAPAVTMWTATLSGANSVPANPSTATGSAMLMLNETTKQATLTGSFSGMTATVAHIHGPAAKTANAGVLIPLTISGGGLAATATLTDAQIADLRNGLWYVNVHSQALPAGEIRGQLERQ